jgi:hypothetical protein
MDSMFYKATALTDIAGLANWTTTSLTNIHQLFNSDTLITDLSPIENWTVTNITDMSLAFDGIPDTVQRPTWYIDN